MPILPLFGHETLRARLTSAARSGALPASLLLHGPAGVGKQRLALHLAQALVCADPTDDGACGACQSCRYSAELTHPDLHWYFPRPRLRDVDASASEVEADYAEAIADRVRAQCVYAAPSGSDGLYVATVRAMLQQASLSPAIARRKVFIVGDAERMVPQEGAEQAANAFLKLLEEPPANTTLVLTSSEPGALLPTIRSRVVAVRVAPLSAADVTAFVDHAAVRAVLGGDVGARGAERVQRAGGRPGRLFESAEANAGAAAAHRLVAVLAGRSRARWLRAGFAFGASKARGGFASTLDELTALLHAQMQAAVVAGEDARAMRLSRSMLAIETAKEQARGNVNPQLAGAVLLRALAEATQ